MRRIRVSDRARRRAGYVTPENAHKMLRHDRYWSTEVLEVLFERCDEQRLQDLEGSWRVVRDLPDLARLIRISDQEDEFPSEQEKVSRQVRCLGLKAEVAAHTGREEEAREALKQAEPLVQRGRTHISAFAALKRRRAVVALKLGDLERARLDIAGAVDLLRRTDTLDELGEALLLSGRLRPSTAGCVDLAEAMARLPLETALDRELSWACNLLLLDRLHEPRRPLLAELEAINGWIRVTRRLWANRADTHRRLGLDWVEGLTQSRLGIYPRSIKRLARVKRGAERLEAPGAAPLVALDLVSEHLHHGEPAAARDAFSEEARQAVAALGSTSSTFADGLRQETLDEAWLNLARRRRPFLGSAYLDLLGSDVSGET